MLDIEIAPVISLEIGELKILYRRFHRETAAAAARWSQRAICGIVKHQGGTGLGIIVNGQVNSFSLNLAETVGLLHRISIYPRHAAKELEACETVKGIRHDRIKAAIGVAQIGQRIIARTCRILHVRLKSLNTIIDTMALIIIEHT